MRKACANRTRSPYTSSDTASGASSASRIQGFACPTAHSATSVQMRCRLSVKAVPVQALKRHPILIAHLGMPATATDCSARGCTAHRPTSPVGLLAPEQRTTARPAPLTASAQLRAPPPSRPATPPGLCGGDTCMFRDGCDGRSFRRTARAGPIEPPPERSPRLRSPAQP